jgi:hypothetical protein
MSLVVLVALGQIADLMTYAYVAPRAAGQEVGMLGALGPPGILAVKLLVLPVIAICGYALRRHPRALAWCACVGFAAAAVNLSAML